MTAVWGPARKSQLTPDVFCGISMNPGMRIWSCYLSSNDVGNPIFQGVYEYVLDMLRTAQHSLIKAKGNKEIFKYAIEHVAAYYAQAKKLFKPGTGPETVRVLKEIEDRITAWDDVEQVKEINNAMIIGLRLQGKWQTSI